MGKRGTPRKRGTPMKLCVSREGERMRGRWVWSACLYQVLRAHDVGLDAFKGVVLGCGHLLERGRVDDDFDLLQGAAQAVRVPDIADEVAHGPVIRGGKFLGHFILLALVAGKHDQAPDVRVVMCRVRNATYEFYPQ